MGFLDDSQACFIVFHGAMLHFMDVMNAKGATHVAFSVVFAPSLHCLVHNKANKGS